MINNELGIKANEDVQYFMNDDMWCAAFPDFINFHDSPAGFGSTKEEALADLQEHMLK